MKSAATAFGHFIAETNLYIAAGAALFTGSAYFFFGTAPNVDVLGTVFFGTLFMYTFQRRVGDLDASGAYRGVKTLLMAAGALGTAFFAVGLSVSVFGLFAGAALLSAAYALPVFPVKGRKEPASLRKLPYLKIWTVTAAWTAVGVAVPLADGAGGDLPGTDAAFFALQQGALIFALAAAFDIRDLPFDAPEHRTVPQILGIRGAVKAGVSAVRISVLSCALLYLFGRIDLAGLGVHAAVCTGAGILLKRTTPYRPQLFFNLGIDGILAAQGLGLMLTRWL